MVEFTFHYGSTYTNNTFLFDRQFASFTFHYGSTYTLFRRFYRCVVIIFTFHYGSTYTEPYHLWCQILHHLHSTMVLLILRFFMEIHMPHFNLHSTMVLLIRKLYNPNPRGSNVFTFHYGSTYTCFLIFDPLIIIVFTFHYGSTYTGSHVPSPSWYIIFTFHYGSTYTNQFGFQYIKDFNLHSTMVLLIPHFPATD